MGDAYEGAFLPFLEAHHLTAQLPPASVLQTALATAAHEGLPGVYAYQVPSTNEYAPYTAWPKPPVSLGWPRHGMPSASPSRLTATWSSAGLINLVQLPAQAFHLTPALVAPTAATLNDHWAAVPAASACMGPFVLGEDDVMAVITRRFMPVPYAYVPYEQNNRVLTPRQAWQVAEQIIADGRAADCQIFLDFLRAACTYHAPADPADALVAGDTAQARTEVPLTAASSFQHLNEDKDGLYTAIQERVISSQYNDKVGNTNLD